MVEQLTRHMLTPSTSVSQDSGTRKRATGLWPDRMRRNTNRAIMVVAGRVTATARADIGAARARRKAWVRGCVQMCDDVVLGRRSRLGVCSASVPWALGRRGGWHGQAGSEKV